ncbi:bifunctional histidinol-phosphatase/imidazoleglycerol-phosphate dehydratase HisB [Legionella sp. W05-934-2]|jgi:imidazoleglycerol-phosphate dehydratase/histidinol-phosphatase|uniref:bifunctional histidinol-phosphatase/imidazoleglycerol-phosphate dehydratase HisB n=1 Tax=Legionella sp. W05-934-2 TaxID=1198649 RepID=UPI00346338EF
MDKVLFIDRDGTLIQEPPDFQVDSLQKIRLVEKVIPSLLLLQEAGFKLVMVSNQDGLGTACFPQKAFDDCQDFIVELFQSQGIQFDDIRICPHFEEDNCHCRKPNIGMVMDYVKERRFDLNHSYVIGDRKTDLALAQNLGITGYRLSEKMTWSDMTKLILSKPRMARINRSTQETQIELMVNLDEKANTTINTPCQFLNHMLAQISKHAGIQIEIHATGDMDVDDHHLVEDIAICLGQAINQALADRRGIERYGFTLPMDESLARVAIDLSGRGGHVFEGQFSCEKVGDLSTEMVPHFFKTLSQNMAATIHVRVEGENTHHMVEACFKAFGRALKQAIQQSGYGIASTKGCL